jgi:hypothetical protein
MGGANACRVLAAALACALIFFAYTSSADDAIEVRTGSSGEAAPAQSVQAELAPGEEAAPPDEAPPADETSPEAAAEPSGDITTPEGAIEVATKKQVPEPKGLTFPVEEGAMYLEAFDRLEVDRNNKTALLEGDALVVLGDLQVEADHIEVNDIAKNVYLKGKVALMQGDDVIFADEGYYSYDTGMFSLINVSGNASGQGINGAIFYKADIAKGHLGEYDLWNAWMSTCPPYCNVYEYELRADKAKIKRDVSLTLYNVYIYIREHKVFWFPQLAVPLRRSEPLRKTESPIQQTYGYNRYEGFFAKFAYTYADEYDDELGATLLGVALLVLTQKQGPGFGLRQDFASPLGVTTLRGFYQRQYQGQLDDVTGVRGEPQSNYEFELLQELDVASDLTGSAQVRRTNSVSGYGARNNSWQNNFNLTYRRPRGNLTLSGNQGITISGGRPTTGGTSKETKQDISSLNFSFDHKFNNVASMGITHRISSSKRNDGVPADLEGTFDADLSFTRPDYGLKFQLKEQIDYDGDRNTTDDRQSVYNLRPGIEFRLQKSAFGKNSFIDSMTVNLDKVVDRRRYEVGEGIATRMKIDTRMSRSYSNDEWSFRPNLQFTQYLYFDGNAQWAAKPSADLTYNNREWFKFNLNWSRTVQRGIQNPPVRRDKEMGRQDIRGSIDFWHDPWWDVSFSSRYDMKNERWSTLNMKWDWYPSNDLSVISSSSYDIESGEFRDLTTTARYYAPSGNWWLKTSATLPLQGISLQHHPFPFSRSEIVYSRQYKRGWSFGLTAEQRSGGNGPLVDDIRITKRNTCTTVNMGYAGLNNEFYINFFINAFPSYPAEFKGYEQADNDWKFEFALPTGSRSDIERGLMGGWNFLGGF